MSDQFLGNTRIMIAYMITDLNNPISCSYAKYATKSWEPVSDIIQIVPYQCVTPKTIHKNHFSWMNNPKRSKSETELAILATFHSLFLRMSFQEFMVLEHDSYLLNPVLFRELFNRRNEFEVFNPGTSMECNLYSPRFAMHMAREIEFNYSAIGPMGLAYYLHSRPEYNWSPCLWPVGKQSGKVGIGKYVSEVDRGFCDEEFKQPVTQCYNVEWDGTNPSAVKSKYSGRDRIKEEPNYHYFTIDKT